MRLFEAIPVWQFEVITLRISKLFDYFDQMLEDNEYDPFEALLRKRNVLVVLDEIVHETAVV